MFTGIVDHTARLVSIEEHAEGRRAWVRSEFSDLVAGESIAVDGACLTVTEPAEGRFAVDISPETLRCTALRHYAAGRAVNVERALRFGDRLGGHIVSGHVDHTVTLSAREAAGDYVQLTFTGLPPTARPFLFPKGSVTVQGVSLTVNTVHDNGFSVMLVPHTLERTTLSSIAIGDEVNLETDWLAKLFLNARKELP